MTDRELLELAAKAAGIANGDCFYDMDQGNEWDPLHDDGDALRLAVKLELFDLDKLLVDLDIHARATSHELDPCAATRRAIVRAAAELGKAMP